MRFDYFGIADAVNATADGKLNVLGLGARVLTLDELPGVASLVVLGSVEAMQEEAGDYELEIVLVDPDGIEEKLLQTTASVVAEVRDPRVPTGMGFTIGLARPYEKDGVYRLRARFDSIAAEYVFSVGPKPAPEAGEPETKPARRSRRAKTKTPPT